MVDHCETLADTTELTDTVDLVWLAASRSIAFNQLAIKYFGLTSDTDFNKPVESVTLQNSARTYLGQNPNNS